MIKKVKVVRYLSASNVRQVCIDHNYYTCGDCDAYQKLLNNVMMLDGVTDEDLLKITENIYNHSNIDKMMMEYGVDNAGIFQSIFYNIAKVVDTHCYVELEEM